MTQSEQHDDDKVCVVGGQYAWSVYRQTAAYICQPNRYFQEDTGRLGFYSDRQIYGAAPQILAVYPEVEMDHEWASYYALGTDPTERTLGLVIAAALADGHTEAVSQVVLLSPIDDPRTVTFEPVRHQGRGAWTQRQRYARLSQLVTAGLTDELTTSAEEVSTDAHL